MRQLLECKTRPSTFTNRWPELRRNFCLLRVEPELTNRRITQSFVILACGRGPGIGDLSSILAGTYQSASVGILGAERLMDSVHIDTDASGTTVRLVQTLPKGIDLTRSICKTWRPRSATRPKPSRSMSLKRTQEITTTLDQLNNQPDRAGSLAIPPRRERDRPRHRLTNWIKDEDLYYSCFVQLLSSRTAPVTTFGAP